MGNLTNYRQVAARTVINDSQHNECMDLISDREPTLAEVSWEDDGTCSYDSDIILETGAPAVPQTELQTQIRNVIIRRKENSSVSSGNRW